MNATKTNLTREQLDKVNKIVDKEVEERCLEAYEKGRASAIKEFKRILAEERERLQRGYIKKAWEQRGTHLFEEVVLIELELEKFEKELGGANGN